MNYQGNNHVYSETEPPQCSLKAWVNIAVKYRRQATTTHTTNLTFELSAGPEIQPRLKACNSKVDSRRHLPYIIGSVVSPTQGPICQCQLLLSHQVDVAAIDDFGETMPDLEKRKAWTGTPMVSSTDDSDFCARNKLAGHAEIAANGWTYNRLNDRISVESPQIVIAPLPSDLSSVRQDWGNYAL